MRRNKWKVKDMIERLDCFEIDELRRTPESVQQLYTLGTMHAYAKRAITWVKSQTC